MCSKGWMNFLGWMTLSVPSRSLLLSKKNVNMDVEAHFINGILLLTISVFDFSPYLTKSPFKNICTCYLHIFLISVTIKHTV